MHEVKVQLENFMHYRSGRFKGFATLPLANIVAAGRKLRRCVEDLGFIGTFVDSNCEGRF